MCAPWQWQEKVKDVRKSSLIWCKSYKYKTIHKEYLTNNYLINKNKYDEIFKTLTMSSWLKIKEEARNHFINNTKWFDTIKFLFKDLSITI